MSVIENAVLDQYREHVTQLYSMIEDWVRDQHFTTAKEPVFNSEEIAGDYSIDKLLLRDKNGNQVAELIPTSASVIAAEGRVDLMGLYDREIIVYLKKSPSITAVTKQNGEKTHRNQWNLYKGIEQEGWYWIEDRRRMKAHTITQELFWELLTGVSDYEFST